MSIVVAATSGHLGRLTVHTLLRRGVPAAGIVAGARSPRTISHFAAAGVRVAALDYDDLSSVQHALRAGDTFVLISGNSLAGRDRQHAEAIAAARLAKVAHLVYTSALQADTNPNPVSASHATTEDAIRDSGIPFTILRNGWYTENYAHALRAARDSGVLVTSVGDGRVASATRQDFADAMGTVVTEAGHTEATYELSGDTAWNYSDLTDAFSEILGQHVSYLPVTPARHAEILAEAGHPQQVVNMAVAVDGNVRAGAYSFQNGDLARLIGRPTTTLSQGLLPLVASNRVPS